MLRNKVALIAAVLVLIFIVFFYYITVVPLSKRTLSEVTSTVERASRLVQSHQRLKAFELLELVETIAEERSFIRSIQIENKDEQRYAVFDAITAHDKKLQAQGRKAHFFGVVDTKGMVIARDLNINNMYGEKLPFSNVAKALQGKASTDVWWLKNRMMRSAAAPIRIGEKVLGAAVIAYDFTAADAREEKNDHGAHVAYFMADSVKAFSFTINNDNATEDAEKGKALTSAIMGAPASPGTAAIQSGKTSELLRLNMLGEDYLAIIGPYPSQHSSQEQKVGFVVLKSITEASAPVARIRWMFVFLALGMGAMVLGGMWFVAKYFLTGLDKLELGVSEVINGNMEYTFEAQDEHEGVANALNVMLSRLLGRAEVGEEGDGNEGAWRADTLFIDALEPDAYGPDLVRRLASETEDAYYSRIFLEYADALKRLNRPLEGVTQDTLRQKLKANEALLKAKHKCQMVRFVLKLEGAKVHFQPVRMG